MLRIALIITRLDRGGSAEAVLNLAEGLKNRGHQVYLIYGKTTNPQQNLQEFVARTGVGLSYVSFLQREINLFKDLIAWWSLIKLLKQFKPDIVHTHSSKAGILGRLAAYSLNVPVIIHSPHGHVFYGYFKGAKNHIFILIERWVAHFTTRLVTLTRRGKEEHLQFKIAPPGKFTVIPCGISIPEFQNHQKNGLFRKQLGFTSKDFVIGWIGRLVPIKGCEHFIKACAQVKKVYPNTKFLIVGDGELRTSLENLSKQLGLTSCLKFTGMRQDIPDILASLDLFVHTSLNEGLGRVILEAMAAEVPVIATQVGGVPDIVRDRQTGFLVPPGNPAALTRTICLVMQNCSTKKFTQRAKSLVQSYSTEKMVGRFERLYQQEISRVKLH